MKKLDLSGQRFGMLTVIEKVGTQKRNPIWRCLCDCGKEADIVGRNLLRNKEIQSCGCSKQASIDTMIGKRFGRLTVIREDGRKRGCVAWLCKCDCGNETSVIGTTLRNGNTQSCGCLHLEVLESLAVKKASNRSELVGVRNLIGLQIDALRVTGKVKRKGEWYWVCECACGKTTYRTTASLIKSGRYSSCGCLKGMNQRRNLEGMCFGRLVVESFDEDRWNATGKIAYKCKCDCGNVTSVLSYCLVSGMTQSCGCLRKEANSVAGSTHGIENSRSASRYLWNVIVNGETINLRSSYERIYALYLIKRNIRFEYEYKRFQLAPSVTYLPDFYLPDYDTWVELKGYESDSWKQKRRMFIEQGNKLVVINSETIDKYLEGETYSQWFSRNKYMYMR